MLEKKSHMTPEQLRASDRRIKLQAYLLVVTVAILGFILMQRQQDQIKESQSCTESFLNATVKVLSERTSYSTEVQKADEKQHRARLRLVELTYSDSEADVNSTERQARTYISALQNYLAVLKKSKNAVTFLTYPSNKQYRDCLQQE